VHVTLRQLAELVQGRLLGDGDLIITAARPLGEAQPGEITFVEDEKHASRLPRSHASAAVVLESFAPVGFPVIQVADPLAAFIAIVRHLHGRAEPPPHGIDSRAVVHPSATVGDECNILPFVTIGEGSRIGARCRIFPGAVIGRFCRLGDDVIVYPNAVLYDDTVIGNRVIIHANAVLGADGFGYRFQNGRHVKVPQLGSVEISDDVEIGAGTTIDRGTFQATRVGTGTKIDNLVQIGHNCRIGCHNLLVSQIGIAGSSSTGDYVIIAGQVGIVEHVHIGDRTILGAKTGVIRDIPPGQRMLGVPALPEHVQKRVWATLERLPELRRELHRIKHYLGMTDGDAEGDKLAG
jgi:UDP-3-O-[3-hydroxymyristoyl] glucosamine N-acyltransferase